MYKILIFILLTNFAELTAQNSYTSKSGHIFKIGDTLNLGQPIKISSGLMVATNGQWSTIFDKKDENLRNMNFINKKAIVTEISLDGKAKVHFRLFGKKLYALIDEAIMKGEVLVENSYSNSTLDKYDKIKKLKELLDIGALTQEEFEAEKKKLLNNN